MSSIDSSCIQVQNGKWQTITGRFPNSNSEVYHPLRGLYTVLVLVIDTGREHTEHSVTDSNESIYLLTAYVVHPHHSAAITNFTQYYTSIETA